MASRSTPTQPIAPENSTHPSTRAQWRAWLAKNHRQPEGVWLVLWKKASGKAKLTYDDVVEEALCFGWVDSKPRSLDEHRSMLWLAPRKPRTGWSAANNARVERAIADERMASAGLEKVEAAKRDGTWNKLDNVEQLLVPDDLAKALAEYDGATNCFDAFPRSVKRSILEWIANARKPETRLQRVNQTAEMASRNERANQWRK